MKSSEFERRCRKIRVVIADIDGVLTDGGMYYSETGDELKKFNVRDGVGVVLMRLAGLKVGAMTGENIKLVKRRLRKIGIDFFFTGVKNKKVCLDRYLSESGYSLEEVAFIGDEINDYCLLKKVGLFLAVADAGRKIRDEADCVLKTAGGGGVLREVAEILLEAQQTYQDAIEQYVSKSEDLA